MGFFEKLRSRLTKARKSFFEGLSQLLKGKRISKEMLEELEERLIAADVGYETTQYILERLKQTQTDDAFNVLKEVLVELLEGNNQVNVESEKPFVITIVGVNGTGKTTTAAKLAAFFQSLGKTVVLGAADTFRAAAIEQLKEWGNRIDCTVISHSEGADSAAVVSTP